MIDGASSAHPMTNETITSVAIVAVKSEDERHEEQGHRQRDEQIPDAIGEQRPLGDRARRAVDARRDRRVRHEPTYSRLMLRAPQPSDPRGPSMTVARGGASAPRDRAAADARPAVEAQCRRPPTLLELLAVQATARPPRRRPRAGSMASVRAVVITGAPPAFSAGADLTGVELGQFTADLPSVLQRLR